MASLQGFPQLAGTPSSKSLQRPSHYKNRRFIQRGPVSTKLRCGSRRTYFSSSPSPDFIFPEGKNGLDPEILTQIKKPQN